MYRIFTILRGNFYDRLITTKSTLVVPSVAFCLSVPSWIVDILYFFQTILSSRRKKKKENSMGDNAALETCYMRG